jgi:hypothetical protein
MRSRWCWIVVVWIGFFWGVGFCGAASAVGKLPWVAQADGDMDEMLDIIAGPQNPEMTLEIHDGIAELSALQVTVTAPPHRNMIIDTVTIGFGIPFGEEVTTGNESFLDELRVQLILEDIEVNGLQDDGEVPEGTQIITDLEEPTTTVFRLSPPWSLEAGSAATFLVIVDINQPETQSTATPFHHATALLLLPIIGFMAYASSRLAPNLRRMFIMFVILGGCGLMLLGCPGDDDDDELRFVVNLPSNGLSGAGQRLGPERAIAGTTIRLMR